MLLGCGHSKILKISLDFKNSKSQNVFQVILNNFEQRVRISFSDLSFVSRQKSHSSEDELEGSEREDGDGTYHHLPINKV